ncbi:MAG: hypothetical protein QME66_04315 [Candidatus Eisenbacteria bacterium]|nr:hypothetical protein [Candidatus Eisenbacteria bacterium]
MKTLTRSDEILKEITTRYMTGQISWVDAEEKMIDEGMRVVYCHHNFFEGICLRCEESESSIQ